jgi:hypothetical protein
MNHPLHTSVETLLCSDYEMEEAQAELRMTSYGLLILRSDRDN